MPDTAVTPSRLPLGLRAVAPLLPAVLAFGVSFGVLAGPRASTAPLHRDVADDLRRLGPVRGGLGAQRRRHRRRGTSRPCCERPLRPDGAVCRRRFRGGWLRRLLEAQLLVDESWALSQRDGAFDRRVLLGAGLALYVGWSGGTAIGVVAGDSLAEPERSASTPPSPPCSWRCWCRWCGTGAASRRPCWAPASRSR